MNARQKAKKYKRMYEALSARSKQPILLNEEEYKIDTLEFTTTLSKQFVALGNRECTKGMVIDAFTNMLTKHFDKYIDYHVEYSPYDGNYILHSQFKVARKLPKLEAEIITRGNCMFCGKELTEGLFFCKECREKARKQEAEIEASKRWL